MKVVVGHVRSLISAEMASPAFAYLGVLLSKGHICAKKEYCIWNQSYKKSFHPQRGAWTVIDIDVRESWVQICLDSDLNESSRNQVDQKNALESVNSSHK